MNQSDSQRLAEARDAARTLWLRQPYPPTDREACAAWERLRLALYDPPSDVGNYFFSDAKATARAAAQTMQGYGLHPSLQDALAEQIEGTIVEFFEDNIWDESE